MKMKPVLTFAALSLTVIGAFGAFAHARSYQDITFSLDEDFDCEQETSIVTASDLHACESTSTLEVSPFCDARALSDNGSIWRVGSNRWNEEWEAKFSEWIQTEADDEFFNRHKIATDCADAAMAFRGIFARIHHLPFRIHAESGRKREAMGHDSKKYANLRTVPVWTESNWKTNIKLDDRFRAYLEYTLREHGTGDMSRNTYPVAITSQDRCSLNAKFGAGTLCFTGDHTLTIKGIDPTCLNPITMISSTTPAEVRTLNVEADRGALFLINHSSTQDPKLMSSLKKKGAGYVRWNWDVVCSGAWTKVKDQAMPDYSEEQYFLPNPSIGHFLREIYHVVPDEKYFNSQIESISSLVEGRVTLVNQAIALQADEAKMAELKDPKSALYDALSTPHRDKKICSKLNDLLIAVNDPESTWKSGHLLATLYAKKFMIGTRESSLLDLLVLCDTNVETKSQPSESLEIRWEIQALDSFWAGNNSVSPVWTFDAKDQSYDATIRINKAQGRIEAEVQVTNGDENIYQYARTQTSLETGKILNYSFRDKAETEFDPNTGLPIFTVALSYYTRQGEASYFGADGKTVVRKGRFSGGDLQELSTLYPDTTQIRETDILNRRCDYSAYCTIRVLYSEDGKKLWEKTLYSDLGTADSPHTKLEKQVFFAIDDERRIKEDLYDRSGDRIKRTTYYRANEFDRLVVEFNDDNSEIRTNFSGRYPTDQTYATADDVITRQIKFVAGSDVTESQYIPETGRLIRFYPLSYSNTVEMHYTVENNKAQIGANPFAPEDGKFELIRRGAEQLTAEELETAKKAAIKVLTERYLVKHPLRQSFTEGLCGLPYFLSDGSYFADGVYTPIHLSADIVRGLIKKVESGACYFGRDNFGNQNFTLPNPANQAEEGKFEQFWKKVKSRFGKEIKS